MQHTNGHALDTHTHTARQIRGKTTETQRRCHQAQHVPHKGTIDGTKCHACHACHAKTHLASQPRARVISEETRPCHIRGKFPRHNRGAFHICDIQSGMLSGIPSDIPSDILSGIRSSILSGMLSGILLDILPGIPSGTLSVYLGFYVTFSNLSGS